MIRFNLKLMAFLLALVSYAGTSLAEEGQYRSRVLIDPGDTLGEGTQLSLEQLEQQLNTVKEPYVRATTSRHLAHEYIRLEAYDRAIRYFEEALRADGLSEIADREILRELARVYLLIEDYPSAAGALERVVEFGLVSEAEDYLLLARAWFQAGDYVATVDSLDRMFEAGMDLDTLSLRQALAMYYQSGAYARCTEVLQLLLQVEPDNAEYWHQLAAVYLMQDRQREALDQLALAYGKRVPFREHDLLLLADLYAYNNQPYDAAQLLAAALEEESISRNGANFRKQFEYWHQAREKDRAISALVEAARLSGDTELYLYLAQLHGESENWGDMQKSVLTACAQELADRYVSRANLLLGVSQLRLNDHEGARGSFINATLIGGAIDQAAQYLRYMQAEGLAEPPTDSELRNIRSPCYGSRDKRRKVNEAAMTVKAAEVQGVSVEPAPEAKVVIATKTAPGQRLFTVRYTLPPTELAESVRPLATRLGRSLVQAGGELDGPLHVLFALDNRNPTEVVEYQLAFPARGNPRSSGRYRYVQTDPFHCSYLFYEGSADGVRPAWTELVRTTLSAGLKPTGQARTVFLETVEGEDRLKLELQLGIEAANMGSE